MINKKIKVTNVYRRNQKAKELNIVNVGGAGSSKSYSLCQFYIFDRLLKHPGYKLLILRKTRQSLKLSTYKMFIDILKEQDIYAQNQHNMSDLIYDFDNNAYVLFSGLDNMEKIKSTEWDEIWIEEGSEFTKEEIYFLSTRLNRGKSNHTIKIKNKIEKLKVHLRLSLNPVTCEVLDCEGQKDFEFIYSTYKDNNFCNEEAKKILEELKEKDIGLYNIYALGLKSVLKGIIYKPYAILNLSDYPNSYDETIYGLDFGFTNPNALLEIRIKDGINCYLKELLYQTHMTNGELIDFLKDAIIDKNAPIYADSAEPDRIEEINQAGFNCIPAQKEVEIGLDFCKRLKFYTCDDNANLNKEQKTYKYKDDKNGKSTEIPVKFNDHLMAAKRYGCYTHLKGTLTNPIQEIKLLHSGQTHFNNSHRRIF